MDNTMKAMIVLSLLLNVAVLAPVTYGIATRAVWVEASYGGAEPARGILLAVYLAIFLASLILLARPVPQAVAVLLSLQIAYKVMTPITVGTLANPVVTANLAIAFFHAITLGLIVLRPQT
ncbi:MAG: hypothetical protein V2J51_11765 [Erythrobacter sp.]|nr:hypothetical protein [Erythrobacter sp.]